jgi:plasmid stabilization system protein ParE
MIDHPEPPAAGRRLVVELRARTEIATAYAWYEEQAPGLGAEFLRALDAVLQRLAREPALYAVVHGRVRRALLRRFPYGVFYAEAGEAVVVLAVVHAHRHPRHWPGRPAR